MSSLYPKVIVAPTTEPITVADVFAQSRISNTEETGLCTGIIKACRQYMERRSARAFIQQTLEIALDDWPWDERRRTEVQCVELPWATPLVSVTSIKLTDSTGAVTTMDPAGYVLDTYSTPGRIAPAWGTVWPYTARYPLSAIVIRYVAGHVGADASPVVPYPEEDVKQAMKFLAAHFYDHREAVIIGENVTIESKALALAFNEIMANWELPAIF